MADFSDPKGDYNPYAPPTGLDAPPPESSSDDEIVISAERATRWWARLIDNILVGVASAPAAFTFLDSYRGRGEDFLSASPMTWVLALVPLALVCYQWSLISTRGQTLGKKWLGIKIVRLDGSPVGFVYGVLLREWVLTVAAFIPIVGNFVGLADALMIFANDRRCMHDHIAGTRVVQTLGAR